jgi:TM2 domain-containing membrane protein YozV
MEVIDDNGNVVPQYNEESKRVLAGVLGIVLGALGIHKFVLGYTTQGIILLVITIATCGIGASVTSIIGLIEGIVYLTKSDEEFVEMYQKNTKEWF